MAKAVKTKTKRILEVAGTAEAVASSAEVNEFSNPGAALVEGSEMQLAVLKGNDIEAPTNQDAEADPAAEEARVRLKDVLTKQDSCYYSVAKDMSYIANKQAYRQWGYKTFEAFLDSEFKMSKRKGQYYVQFINYFESALRTTLKDQHDAYSTLMDTIREAGWIKGRVLARMKIVSVDNVAEVTEKIRTLGYRDLEIYCKTVRDQMTQEQREDTEENPTVGVNFKCFIPQKDDIEAAIELAKVMIGKDTTRSGAIAWVARDFVATNVQAQGKDRAGALAELLSKYERLFGVSLIAIDEATKACTFGQENLDRLSK